MRNTLFSFPVICRDRIGDAVLLDYSDLYLRLNLRPYILLTVSPFGSLLVIVATLITISMIYYTVGLLMLRDVLSIGVGLFLKPLSENWPLILHPMELNFYILPTAGDSTAYTLLELSIK